MRRKGLGPFGLNFALALLAAGAIVSVASAPAAQSPPAGSPALPFSPPPAASPSIADGGVVEDGGAPEGGVQGSRPEVASGTGVGTDTDAGTDADAGTGAGTDTDTDANRIGAGSLGLPAPPADDRAAHSAEGSPASGRILDPKKIYVSIPVALGVSASVNFAMGIAFTVLSNAKVAKTEGVWMEIQGDGGRGACNSPAFARRCDELYEADSDRQTYRNMAVLSYVGAVGFALGAGASYFLLFKGSEGKEGGPSALVLDIGPTGGGAALKGTF
ncbi:MAG: hypothetical protein L6Q76_08095 [Polyangiaceae bacterium]|nr:hypothetical protein [Polyangiaceae bacterium]